MIDCQSGLLTTDMAWYPRQIQSSANTTDWTL